MTPSDIAAVTRAMGPVVREFTAKAVADATLPLLPKIAALETQLDKDARRIEGYTSFLQRDVAELLERNTALEQRILELETAPEPLAGPAGPVGQKGDAGPGISSLVVSAEGRLLAHLTDGRSLDAGPVPPGRKGETGERGEAGPIGFAGTPGPTGERGESGEKGAPGLVGDRGPQGERGEPGQSLVGPQGDRGLDAPSPDLEAIVTRVLALVPPAARGERGEIGPVGPSGASGEKGDSGRDAEVPDVAAMVARAVSALPVPTNGRDGKDADQIDLDAVVTRVAALIPVPKDGPAGADGTDGRSVTVDEVMPLLVREIEQRVTALPVPKDGTGFTGAVINREGHLMLTLSNGSTQDVGLVTGRDGSPGLDGKDAIGTPGKDGLDGLGFDDFDLALDETRGWIFRLVQGERVKEWELGLPFDAKVWAAGSVYPKGAGVTWDGHYWLAQAQTSDQPGEGNPSWRLAVRRGKQGREGKQGKDGSAGRDLTQMDPATGRKW